MSDLTTETVATFLAADNNVVTDELDGRVGLYATGNTIHIEVAPRRAAASGPEGGEENAVRFEAHVFPVEPALPAATEPVHLDPATARELTYLSPGEDLDGWTVVKSEEHGHTRWNSHHTLIIRNDAGEHFAGHYRKGLTENQDTKPWEGERTARFDPVVSRARVAQVHNWVTPAKRTGPAPAAS
ncbi:hypothetical protein ETD86_40885 [Nonomuraea turkmeniaca]|uniref:Uncharacterized protein n=1 Tax=Nonomuraea turkmeniaca TaxID=103838 RepID=A0A5S4F274_9ACTN|nr:hypothetical protein [Nonomuraea turkmeniaca]TMR10083.1 hypothetical protein ETD86_40885 [Nonomuraea turkmeniaca]